MPEDMTKTNNEIPITKIPEISETPEVVESSETDDRSKNWQSNYRQEAMRAQKYRRRAQEAELELDQLRSCVLSSEQLTEYDNLRNRAEMFVETERKASQLEGMVNKLAGKDELIKSLVTCGVGRGSANGREMIDQAVCLLAGQITVDSSGDEPVVTVRRGPGKPSGKDITVSQFVADWLARAGAHFLPPSGDTGSGAHGGSVLQAGQTLAELDAHPQKKAKFIATRGLQAYVQLAQSTRQ